MAVQRSEKMRCACDSTLFVTAYGLWRHPGKGMTPKVEAYICLSCQKPLDMEVQSRLADLKKQQAELERINEQIAEIEGKTPVISKRSSVKSAS